MSNLEMFVNSFGVNHQLMSVCLKPKIPFVITPTLAHDIRVFQNKLAEKYYCSPWESTKYVCWHLHAGKVKWKGLDFNYILDMLKINNSSALERYIEEVFDLMFLNYVSLDVPLLNCSILNRPVRGISQDFFYLNQINFIKKSGIKHFAANERDIVQIDVNSYKQKLSFPKKIYNRNKYYEFYCMNVSKIGELLDSLSFNEITKDEFAEIKKTFEELKESTNETIYELASKNLKLIERLACLQVKNS